MSSAASRIWSRGLHNMWMAFRSGARARGLGPGAWGLEPGAWGLGPGAWGLGPGALGLGPGAWGLGPGAWGLGPGVWGLEPGAWSLEPGAWSLEPGAWGLGPGAWGLGLEELDQEPGGSRQGHVILSVARPLRCRLCAFDNAILHSTFLVILEHNGTQGIV